MLGSSVRAVLEDGLNSEYKMQETEVKGDVHREGRVVAGKGWQVCPPLKTGRSTLQSPAEFLVVMEIFSICTVQYCSH